MSLVSAIISASADDKSGITFIGASGVGEYTSYKELYQQALLALGVLCERGVSPDDEVIIQLDDNKSLLVTFWACLLGGMVPVLLSAGSQPEQKLKLLNICKYLSRAFWVTEAAQVERIRNIAGTEREAEFNRVAGSWIDEQDIMNSQVTGTVVKRAGSDTAYIQFSSGSTGDAKGVLLTHDNLLCNIRDIIQSLQITSRDTLLSWMPLTHDMGLIGFHLTGVVQRINAVCIPTALYIRRPLLWMDITSRYAASVLYSPNFGFEYFLAAMAGDKSYEWDLSCIRLIVCGAEPISPQLCRKFTETLSVYGLHQHTILPAYGLAEAAVEVSAATPGHPVICHFLHRDCLNLGDIVTDVVADHAAAVEFVEVGEPVSACMVMIADEYHRELPPDTIGNILVKGGNITAGYYNHPAATAAAFTPDGWLKTGDIGFLRQGRLTVTGRAKNIIILKGQNYYPQDIERVIIRQEIAAQGKVVACGFREESTATEELLVFVLFKGDAITFEPAIAAVKHAVMTAIGIEVSHVLPVKKIPKTTSGKIQYYQLVEQYKRTYRSPQDTIARVVTREDLQTMMTAFLGAAVIDPDADLLANGFSSLMMMQLAERIRKRYNRVLPVSALFGGLTPEKLYTLISAAGVLPMTDAPPADGHQLSVQQLRIWMEYQINPAMTAYNVPVIFSMKHRPDILLLERCINILISRHEMLRTSFYPENGIPQRKVHAYADHFFSLQYLEEAVTGRTEECCNRWINQPFNLEQPTQLRAVVAETNDAGYIFLFVVHHIIVDGWSLSALFTELELLYDHLSANPGHVPALSSPVQYSTYVNWQQQMQASVQLQADRRYWLEDLQTPPEPAGLPARTTTTSPLRNNAADYLVVDFLAGDTGLLLQHLTQKYEATPFCILMSAIQVLIYRYTMQQDIITGYDVAGQPAAGMEDCTGYMLNTLCLRTQINAEMTFVTVVEQVKNKLAAGLAHQLFPFEQLLDDMRLKGTAYGNGLFKLLVVYNNFRQNNGDTLFGGPDSRRLHFAPAEGFVETFLEFTEANGQLTLLVQYNSSLYDRSFIENFTSHLQQLLQAVATVDTLPVSRLYFLTAAERDLVYAPSQPDHASGISLVQAFEEQAGLHPEKNAVVAGDVTLSYQKLKARVDLLAGYLAAQAGGRLETRIGFMVSRNENMIIAMLAILKAGMAYVPLDPEYPVSRCMDICADSAVMLLLTDSPGYDRLRSYGDTGIIVNMEVLPKATVPLVTAQKHMPEDVAYIIYTSGSTGRPKGIMITHASLTDYVSRFVAYFAVTAADIVLQQASVVFDTVIEEVFPALITGGTVVIAPEGGRNIEALLQLTDTYKATILSTTPLVLHELNAAPYPQLRSLRMVISGGDVLHAADIDRLLQTCEVYNTYGPSEATVCATYMKVTSPEQAPLIGRVVPGKNVYILDDNGQIMPAGVTGEICIAGGLARGYLGMPELTAEKFITAPFDHTQRIYRTGDIGKVTPDGNILFVRRRDIQVKVRGHRVEPEEIEQMILVSGMVHTAAVICDAQGGRLVAFVTVTGIWNEEQLRIFLAEKLPYYMLPQRIVTLPAMPTGVTGKLDRRQLSAMAADLPQQMDVPAGELSTTEQQLLELVREVLGTREIAVTGNLFDFGCNSIKIVQLSGLIHQVFQCRLPLRDFFLFPAVRSLAERIAPGQQQYSDIPMLHTPDATLLSPAQQRLWIMQKIDPASWVYNEATHFTVEGRLDEAKVRAAFERLVIRHEILRTRFPESAEGSPLQLVDKPEEHTLAFSFCDVGTAAEPSVVAAQLIADAIRKPFDLGAGPLYRLLLVRDVATHYHFLVVMHHIITDDWSARLLLKEFLAYYHAPATTTSESTQVNVRYRDYAAWQNHQLNTAGMQADRDYWRQVFRDNIPVLDLPADAARPAMRQREAKCFHTCIDEQLLQQLRHCCREQEASLFMLLLSAMGTLFARYSHQYDLVIGTPVAGREHPGLQHVCGFFINMLPLRIRINEGDTPDIMLQQVKQVCLDAYEHQSYPFDLLINDLQVDRNMGRSPVFDVLINLSGNDTHAAEMPTDSKFIREKRNFAGNKYDVAFFFEESEEGLSLAIEYDAQLYQEDRIAKMATHFINIAGQFAKRTPATVGTLSYMEAQEQQQLLYDFNAYELPLPEENLLDMFRQQAAAHPTKTAVLCEGRTLSYRQLHELSDQLTARLTDDGCVKQQDVVCLFMDRTEQMLIALLAVWKAGATYLPVEPGTPMERVAYILGDTAVSTVVTDKATMPLFRGLPFAAGYKVICTEDEIIAAHHLPSRKMADIAYVIYTSGSTGDPKGVAVYQQAVLNVVTGLRHQLPTDAADIMLSVSTYIFDISVTEFFLPLTTGGTLILATGKEVRDASLLCALISHHMPTIMQGTPGLWNMLVQSGWEGTPGLIAITCGEALSDDLRTQLLPRVRQLWNLYGPTEATVFATGRRIITAEEPISIGYPFPNNRVYILDKQKQLVPVGIWGQLYIGGAGIARGYVNKPELTAQKFDCHLTATEGCLYATGDTGRWLPDGNIEYGGRVDDQVKIRGYRIEMGEIEHCLLQHDNVKVATLVVQGSNDDRSLLAFVVFGEATEQAENNLRNHLLRYLPAYMLPARIIGVQALPFTSNGKIDKKNLLAGMEAMMPGKLSSAAAANTKTEERLLQLWQQLLNRTDFGVEDNFFHLGGHSLKANQMLNIINREMGLELKLANVFTNPTISGMAEYIKQVEEDAYQFIEL